MTEKLAWSLSDGPPETADLGSKEAQRSDAARTRADVDPRVLWKGGETDPATKEMNAEAWDEMNYDSWQLANEMRDEIHAGLASDPLDGAAERGGYMLGEAED